MSDDKTRTRAAAGDTTAGGSEIATTEPGTENTTGEATIVPTWGVSSIVALPDPGYQLGELIGRGGMGEVVAAQDQRVGREVAVKRIRSKTPTHDAVQRFLREARIQARLDHPAIVPVYELGTDADGCPYFTMKRLTGVTLGKRLGEHGPIQPLLRAFVDVCLAIQLAHSRGVVHRDLKPSNIMLGDYGEVYVIDWGVARVVGDRTRVTHPMRAIEDVSDDEQTTAGAILGTPGYMPPEQIRGSEVGAPADVYALGAILFEILAGEPLHPRGEAALATTLTSPQVAPTSRVERTIAPELDGVCFDALAEDPHARPTARELADRIQAYIDGDRDVERRRTLAASQLAAALEALDSEAPDARARAMRRAGRALALDPDSRDAAALVTQLMVEPPAKLPRDLVASLDAEDRETNKNRLRRAMWAYASIAVFIPLIPFLDTKSWMLQFTFWSLVAMLAVLAYSGRRTGNPRVGPSLVANLALVLVFSRLAGPFILTPIVTTGILLSFSSNPFIMARRWILLAWGTAAVLLPIALELTGVLPRTFEIVDGSIRITSDFYRIGGGLEEGALILANCGFILIGALFALGIGTDREQTRRKLHIQAWHLRQLLPNQQPRRTRG